MMSVRIQRKERQNFGEFRAPAPSTAKYSVRATPGKDMMLE
jgi:hypothetical protein